MVIALRHCSGDSGIRLHTQHRGSCVQRVWDIFGRLSTAIHFSNDARLHRNTASCNTHAANTCLVTQHRYQHRQHTLPCKSAQPSSTQRFHAVSPPSTFHLAIRLQQSVPEPTSQVLDKPRSTSQLLHPARIRRVQTDRDRCAVLIQRTLSLWQTR